MKKFWYGVIVILLILFVLLAKGVKQDCSTIYNRENRSICFISSAIQDKDPTICDNLRNGGEINNQDKTFCYAMYSSHYDDVSICRTILDEEDNCYYFYASIKNDPNICNNIIHVNKTKEELSKSYCVYSYSLDKSDFSACEVLSLQESKDFCYNALKRSGIDQVN